METQKWVMNWYMGDELIYRYYGRSCCMSSLIIFLLVSCTFVTCLSNEMGCFLSTSNVSSTIWSCIGSLRFDFLFVLFLFLFLFLVLVFFLMVGWNRVHFCFCFYFCSCCVCFSTGAGTCSTKYSASLSVHLFF